MQAHSVLLAVVIPCYRVRDKILGVIAAIPEDVAQIHVVDDACPENSGDLVTRECADARVTVHRHEANRGVGGAMATGYEAALVAGADIVVKIDGDGQMDPALIPTLIRGLLSGKADYAKGNRFYDLEMLRAMPGLRLFGNSVLSLVNKLASGYWDVMDPTNGYAAIHRTALHALPLDKIDRDYFFESDMLFRLYTIRAVVRDVPMPARYADEKSSLRIGRAALVFPGKYLLNTIKRFFYSYLLRDFNAGTMQFLLGIAIGGAGTLFGITQWRESVATGVPATAGSVMAAALPVLVGVQLWLAALHYDILNIPREPLQQRM
jgi:glycosyltransferase involved in cell wall biosynthesis